MGTRENAQRDQISGGMQRHIYNTGIASCQARVAWSLDDSLGRVPHTSVSASLLARLQFADRTFLSRDFADSTSSIIRRFPIYEPSFASGATASGGGGVHPMHKPLCGWRLGSARSNISVDEGKAEH